MSKYSFEDGNVEYVYPDLHIYPDKFSPDTGIKLLKNLNIKGERMLDPFCGAGNMLTAGLAVGFKEIHGCDINPVAISICKSKFNAVSPSNLREIKMTLENNISKYLIEEKGRKYNPIKKELSYWLNEDALDSLNAVKVCIKDTVKSLSCNRNTSILNEFFYLCLVDTLRECSYVKVNNFDVTRMPPEEIERFICNPVKLFFSKLDNYISIYENNYYPLIKEGVISNFEDSSFSFSDKNLFDVVFTEPPYGNDPYVVDYERFTFLANLCMDYKKRRELNRMSIGGDVKDIPYLKGNTQRIIRNMTRRNVKYCNILSTYFFDMENHISEIAKSVKKEGTVIYVIKNRRLKLLKIDNSDFIQHCFSKEGFKHVCTYEKSISRENQVRRGKGDYKDNVVTDEKIIVLTKE